MEGGALHDVSEGVDKRLPQGWWRWRTVTSPPSLCPFRLPVQSGRSKALSKDVAGRPLRAQSVSEGSVSPWGKARWGQMADGHPPPQASPWGQARAIQLIFPRLLLHHSRPTSPALPSPMTPSWSPHHSDSPVPWQTGTAGAES